MPPELKKQENVEYPKGWAFVSNQGEAYYFMRGLWDSPTDIIRVNSSMSRDDLDAMATKAIKVPQKYIEDVKTILQGNIPQNAEKILEKFSPYVIIMPNEFFDSLRGWGDGSAFHVHLDGSLIGAIRGFKSNVIFIRKDMYEYAKDRPDKLARLITHETLHYFTAITRTEERKNRGLNEGITDYFTCKYIYQKDYPISGRDEAYLLEIIVAHVLSRIAGEEELKKAYFTGDFSKVKAEVNRKGGFGTWEKITDLIEEPQDYTKEKIQKGFNLVRMLMASAKLDEKEIDSELEQMGKMSLESAENFVIDSFELMNEIYHKKD